MDMKELRENARKNLKGFCTVCKICNGVACSGEVPGMGGTGTGSSFKINVDDLAHIKLRLKTLHNAKNPSTDFNLFNTSLKMPIMAAPITGTEFNMGGYLSEEEYIEAVVKGSLDAGSLPMIGDSAEAQLYSTGIDVLSKYDSLGIGIIKPKSNKEVIRSINLAEKNGLRAVGMDVDGAGLITMALKGVPVGPKNIHDLKEIISSTDLPFILKGVMTPEEALIAIECGASAIVVSNHGGRVLDHTESTAKALDEIAKLAKGKITILVDGGIRTGTDVFKMLALGADGVLIGRPLITGAFGNKSDVVRLILETMQEELYKSMILTGAKDLASINRNMISVTW